MGTNQFARLLKYYLMLNDKAQSDLVNDLGYEKSTVSNWCSGARVPKIDTIIDIAKYLHVEPGDLIVESENKPTYTLTMKQLRKHKRYSRTNSSLFSSMPQGMPNPKI